MEYKTLQYTVCITRVHLMVVHTMVCVCVCLRLYLYCVRHGDTQPVFGRSPTTSSQSSSFVRLWRLIKKNCVCAVEYNMIFGWLDENYFLLFFCLRLHNYTRKPTQTTFYLISILFFSFFPFYFSRRKKKCTYKTGIFLFLFMARNLFSTMFSNRTKRLPRRTNVFVHCWKASERFLLYAHFFVVYLILNDCILSILISILPFKTREEEEKKKKDIVDSILFVCAVRS